MLTNKNLFVKFLDISLPKFNKLELSEHVSSMQVPNTQAQTWPNFPEAGWMSSAKKAKYIGMVALHVLCS